MRRAARLGFVVVILLLQTAPANAHPLGNFTINRFSGLEIGTDGVRVRYVVDFAEIAAFQEIQKIDSDGDNRASTDELETYVETQGPLLQQGLVMTADGEDVDLALEEAAASTSPGQGGLDLLRVEMELAGSLSDADATIEYRDENYQDRVGWQEIIATAVDGQGLADSDVPDDSVSNELKNYPRDMLDSPVQTNQATVEVAPGASGSAPEAESERLASGPESLFGGSFASLVGEEMSVGFLFSALLLSLGAGALHALGPGHGKTVMAAYLVGAEGRARHAVTVGIAVSLMHTASVVALGLITLWAASLFPPEAVYPWLSLLSGLAVTGVGVWLVRARLKSARDRHHEYAHAHSHSHEHSHEHEHEHSHGLGTHTHALPDSPLSRKGLGAIALSGGLLPSPTALVVLLGAIALHRVALGVTLVLAFSIGLAAALTMVGLLVLRARDFAQARLKGRSGTWLPVASAAVVACLGVFLTFRALLSF